MGFVKKIQALELTSFAFQMQIENCSEKFFNDIQNISMISLIDFRKLLKYWKLFLYTMVNERRHGPPDESQFVLRMLLLPPADVMLPYTFRI